MPHHTIVTLTPLPISTLELDGGVFTFTAFQGDERLFEQCEVICTTPFNPVDAELIARLPERIKLIASIGVGIDHIDIEAARQRNILVTNTPIAKDDTADFTFALLLASARHLLANNRFVQQGEWTPETMTGVIGHSVHHQTLGIVGSDALAAKVAKRALGFDMRVHYHHDRPSDEMDALGAHYCERLEDLLPEVDYLALLCPLTADNHHMINANTLALMKPCARLINTFRGALVDEQALVDALDAGTLAGAALDAFEHEPDMHPGLKARDNVLLTPHISSGTQNCRQEMVRTMLKNLGHYFLGEQEKMDLIRG